MLEMVRDYLALVAAVKEVLGERVKTFLAWQNAVNTLHKKREQRSRMELGGRLDKVTQSSQLSLRHNSGQRLLINGGK